MKIKCCGYNIVVGNEMFDKIEQKPIDMKNLPVYNHVQFDA